MSKNFPILDPKFQIFDFYINNPKMETGNCFVENKGFEPLVSGLQARFCGTGQLCNRPNILNNLKNSQILDFQFWILDFLNLQSEISNLKLICGE